MADEPTTECRTKSEPGRPLTHAERGALGGAHSTYSAEEVERGLQTLAATRSCNVASEHTGIPASTLTYWTRNQHRDRYEQIRRELAPKIHDAIASEMEDFAAEIVQVERKALKRLDQTVETLDAKDAAAAVKNLTFAKTNSVDKILVLRGRPNQITERKTPQELMSALKRAGIQVIDGDAEEIK